MTLADWCPHAAQENEPTVCVVSPTEATEIMKEILKGEPAPCGPASLLGMGKLISFRTFDAKGVFTGAFPIKQVEISAARNRTEVPQ